MPRKHELAIPIARCVARVAAVHVRTRHDCQHGTASTYLLTWLLASFRVTIVNMVPRT